MKMYLRHSTRRILIRLSAMALAGVLFARGQSEATGPSILDVEAYLKLAAAESYPPRILQYGEAALALDGLTDTDRARVLRLLAGTHQTGNCYDLALDHLARLLQLKDIPPLLRLGALRQQGIMARELRRHEEARQAFESLIALPGVPPDEWAMAHVELIETILHPTQYAWNPSEEDLRQALQVYARVGNLPAMTTPLRSRALMGIARAQRLAGQSEAAIETAQKLLGDRNLNTMQTARTHELIGDNYMDLKNYKKAVAHYEHALGADKYAILNKLATAARRGGNFSRAMQAYADLVPMIDKVEAQDDYNRVTRLLVAMTEATRRMMKTPAAAEVFQTDGDRAIGALTLDDDI